MILQTSYSQDNFEVDIYTQNVAKKQIKSSLVLIVFGGVCVFASAGLIAYHFTGPDTVVQKKIYTNGTSSSYMIDTVPRSNFHGIAGAFLGGIGIPLSIIGIRNMVCAKRMINPHNEKLSEELDKLTFFIQPNGIKIRYRF